jgi:redox-sensitive bicupin YhaK (pirin superfamily)
VKQPTTEDVELELPEDASTPGEFLWMQGKPIEDPVAEYGPFVMNTEEEIRQAFSDCQSRDAHVHSQGSLF